MEKDDENSHLWITIDDIVAIHQMGEDEKIVKAIGSEALEIADKLHDFGFEADFSLSVAETYLRRKIPDKEITRWSPNAGTECLDVLYGDGSGTTFEFSPTIKSPLPFWLRQETEDDEVVGE